jgi:hypothetical protein
MLILFSITGAEHLVGFPSSIQYPEIDEEFLRLWKKWMRGGPVNMVVPGNSTPPRRD